jgi:DNA-binding SARP family transcriptional activator
LNKAFDHYEKYEEMLDLEMGIKPEENLQNLLKNI